MKRRVIAGSGDQVYPGLIFLSGWDEESPEVGHTLHLGVRGSGGEEVSIEVDETGAYLLHDWLEGWMEEYRS